MERAISWVSNAVYLIVTVSLMLLALGFVVFSFYLIGQSFLGEGDILPTMLSAVSLLVIALAVSDVAKFLLEEQVVGDRDLRSAGEVRRTLSKFLTIVIIAASMEAIVFMFDREGASHERVAYGAMLLAGVALLVVASAIHQRLTRSVEQSAPEEERRTPGA